MKKIVVLILLTGCLATNSYGQSKKQIARLAELAQAWGLLKYYHPAIAAGKQDWDSVLIETLQHTLSDSQGAQFTAAIDRLLTIAGPDTASFYLPVNDQSIAYKNYDASWINRSKQLNEEQKKALNYILSHPNRAGNVYARQDGSPDSTVTTPHEKPYKEMLLPDVHYRLLGLFRFWNVINYYYPYKYKIGKPWNQVLHELIPVMIEASDTLSYHRAIARMAASINDAHGGLWPEVYSSFTGKYAPGFHFRLVDGKAVVTRIIDSLLLKEPAFQVGSVLTSINGVTIKQLIKRYTDYVPASNVGGKLKTMHGFLLNTFTDKAEYRGISRDGKKMHVTLPQTERNFLQGYLDFFEMKSADTCKILPGNIGYVYFSNLNSRNLHSVMRSLLHTRAIIFDMRNYPENGAGIYRVPDYLLSQPAIYARNTYPDFSLPGRFNYIIANEGTNYSRVGGSRLSPDVELPYQGKIILLVDSRTQSAAEWACMTLLTAKNVTVIGNQTAGTDGNVTRTILPGGYKIAFSGLGIYFPNGAETQRAGIPIDIHVTYRISDIINGRDPLLEKALDWLK